MRIVEQYIREGSPDQVSLLFVVVVVSGGGGGIDWCWCWG